RRWQSERPGFRGSHGRARWVSSVRAPWSPCIRAHLAPGIRARDVLSVLTCPARRLFSNRSPSYPAMPAMTREISRQAFVRGALGGVVAGALLGSCRSTAPEPPASPSASASSPSPPTTVSGPQDWSALDEAIDGRVVLPSSADYAAAKSVFNARFDVSTPAAVV